MTSSVTQVESPDEESNRFRILRRTSFTPPNSLIQGAKRSARLKAGVIVASVGPLSIEITPFTRSGRRYASRNAADLERVEHRGHTLRLGGERVVRFLGPRRGADAERLDHDGAVACVVEERDQ